jgi:hypothetical protein
MAFLSRAGSLVGLHQRGQHQTGAGPQGKVRAVAGGLQEFHCFVAQSRFGNGENGKGFERHGTNGDAVFRKTGADQRNQAQALGAGHRIERSRDEDVAARLPFLHGQLGGHLGEEITIGGENAGFAAADEAGQFGGAAVIIRIVGAQFLDQLSDSRCARFREERASGGVGIGRFPASRGDWPSWHSRFAY